MATEQLSLGQPASTALDSTGDVATTLPLAERKVLGLTSLIVGIACVYLVGFAPMMTVHNAAHDTRHTSAFPCH